MTDFTTLPGAGLALEVKYLTRSMDVGDHFTTHYSEHKWDDDTHNFVPDEPHFITYANCSDVFWWGSSDSEEITDENIRVLRDTIAELTVLYVARSKIESDPEFKRLAFEETSAVYAAHVAECPLTTPDGKHENDRGCSRWTPGATEHKMYAYQYQTNIAELFAARVREMRPQGACYKGYPKDLWPLFDACGPERETGMGNPHAAEEYA